MLNSSYHKIIKRKLQIEDDIPNPFLQWRKFCGFFSDNNIPLRNGVEMKLNLNTSSKQCICGHRAGKLKSSLSKEAVYDDGMYPHIELNLKNNLTSDYNDSSLIPYVKIKGETYILVGKKCAEHFKEDPKYKHKSIIQNSKKKTEHSMDDPTLFDYLAYKLLQNKIKDKNTNQIIENVLFSIESERKDPNNIYVIGKSDGKKLVLSSLDEFGIRDITRFIRHFLKKGYLPHEIPLRRFPYRDIIILDIKLPIGLIFANIEFIKNKYYDIEIRVKNYKIL